jgi:thiamine transport system permease protein
VLALGGIGRNTIETEIYRLTTQELALDRAGALVIVQIVAVLLVLLASARAQRGAARFGTASNGRSRPGAALHGVSDRLRVTAALLPAAVLVVVPFGALIGRSSSASFAAYRQIGETSTVLGASPLDALRRSLLVALAATVIAVALGALASIATTRPGRRRAVVDAVVLLPLGVSAVSVGYGFLIALDRPIDLRTSWWIVPLAHATVALPFVVFIVVPALRSVDPHTREAAALLGAPPRTVWRTIDLAVARRALVVAAGFAAAVSLGEFGASSFVARVGAPTAPLAIYRLLGRPGSANVQSAYALATLLAVAVAVVVLLGERVEGAYAR